MADTKSQQYSEEDEEFDEIMQDYKILAELASRKSKPHKHNTRRKDAHVSSVEHETNKNNSSESLKVNTDDTIDILVYLWKLGYTVGDSGELIPLSPT